MIQKKKIETIDLSLLDGDFPVYLPNWREEHTLNKKRVSGKSYEELVDEYLADDE